MNWYKKADVSDYYPKLYGALQQYQGQGLFVHFTDIAKLGINPQPSHQDPIGIYFFPLDHLLEVFGKYTVFQFKKFMFICQVTPNNVLNLSDVNEAELKRYLEQLEIERQKGTRGDTDSPYGADLWYSIKRSLEEQSQGKYNMPFRQRFMQLGFDAIRDIGSGVIHSNEPDQLLVLDPSIINIVDMIETNVSEYKSEEPQQSEYPFYSKTTKPAIMVANALAEQMGMSMLSPPHASNRGDGYWNMRLVDEDKNVVTVGMQLSRGSYYKSFSASFFASWFSDGIQVSFSDTKVAFGWASAPPEAVRYNFDVNTPYEDVSAEFAQKLQEKLREQPPNLKSYVEPIGVELQNMLGGDLDLDSLTLVFLEIDVNGSPFRISLQMQSYDQNIGVSGSIQIPKHSFYSIYDPSFNIELPKETNAREVISSIYKELTTVVEKHFRLDDENRRYENEYSMQYINPVLDLLRGSLPQRTSASRNWYKTAQDVYQQYQQALQQAAAAIEITGTGQNEMLTLPGTNQTIQARDLLQRVKSHIAPVLLENHVTKINTDPIAQATAQGLAVSHEPGEIHVDVAKIFNAAKQSLPAVSQMDGMEPDPDAMNAILHQVSQMIEAELMETVSHESFHTYQYFDLFQKGQPFSRAEEQPAEQFGRQTRHRYDYA